MTFRFPRSCGSLTIAVYCTVAATVVAALIGLLLWRAVIFLRFEGRPSPGFMRDESPLVRSWFWAPQDRKVRRTMAELRELASAVWFYAAEHHAYPEAGSIEELAAKLEPTFIGRLPRRDGWGREYRYAVCRPGPGVHGPETYAIASAGSDGSFEHANPCGYPAGTLTRLEADLVFGTGCYVRYWEDT